MADLGSAQLITTPPPIERVGQQSYGKRGGEKEKADPKEARPNEKTNDDDKGKEVKTKEPVDGKGGNVDIVI